MRFVYYQQHLCTYTLMQDANNDYKNDTLEVYNNILSMLQCTILEYLA